VIVSLLVEETGEALTTCSSDDNDYIWECYHG